MPLPQYEELKLHEDVIDPVIIHDTSGYIDNPNGDQMTAGFEPFGPAKINLKDEPS